MHNEFALAALLSIFHSTGSNIALDLIQTIFWCNLPLNKCKCHVSLVIIAKTSVPAYIEFEVRCFDIDFTSF